MHRPLQGRRLAGAGLLATTALLLSACNDGNNATPLTPSPTPPSVPAPVPPPAPAPVPMTSVTLSGRVVDEPIPNASVVATVAGMTFNATADANGNYTLPITLPTSMAAGAVLLTATGTGAQANVVLTSLPGSLANLATDAGGDGVVNAAENIRSNVTHVSTAEAVLVTELNQGAAPASQAELDTLVKQVDPNALLDLAATIKLIVDTAEYELPAGVSNTLQFAQAPAVRDDYIAAIQQNAPEDLEQAKQDTVASPDVVMAMDANAIPDELLASTIDNDARININSFNVVTGFTFAADGTGSTFDGVNFGRTIWQRVNNQIRVTLDNPQTTRGFPLVDTNGDGVRDTQVAADTTVSSFSLAVLGESLVSITSNFSVDYPNNEVPDEPNRTETSSAVIIDPEQDLGPFLPTGFATNGGRLLTSTFSVVDGGGFAGDIFNFAPGGTGVAEARQFNFGWSLAAGGALTMTLADDVVVRYSGFIVPFSNQDPQTELVLAEVTRGAARYVDIIKVIRPAAPLSFVAATVPGSYFLYGRGNEEDGESNIDTRLQGFRLDFAGDNTGFQGGDFINSSGEVVTNNADTQPFGFFRWSLETDGRLVVRRNFDTAAANEQAQRRCNPATTSTCQTFDQREIIPFAINGDRYYWLERRRFAQTGFINDSTPVSYIQRFWDKN